MLDTTPASSLEIAVPAWWAAIDEDSPGLSELAVRVIDETQHHPDADSLAFAELVVDMVTALRGPAAISAPMRGRLRALVDARI